MEETCQSNTLDWSSLVLSYFSLQQIFSNDFSVVSQLISIKFDRFIVLDETKSLNIISSQKDQGSGQGVVPKFHYAL